MDLACREIVNRLEEQYPSSCAEEWDNVGLLDCCERYRFRKVAA